LLVTHLIRKDLHAIAIIALIWSVLIAIDLTVQLTGLIAVTRGLERGTPPQMLLTLLPFAEVAIGTLLVSLVIHEDPLVDTRAFWLTRPIPRGRLFIAKLTTIALVIFTPALAALAILLAWYHVPPVYMMRAGLELVLWLAVPVLFLTAAATLTSTLSRYLLLLFGVMVAALAIIGLMETFRPSSASVSLGFQPRLPRFDDPAPQVTVALLLIAGFCVTLHQYYRRRDWRVALGGIAMVFALAFMVVRYFPDFTFFEPPGTAQGAWMARVRLRLLDDQKLVSAYHPRELRSVAAPLVLEGLPEGYTAIPFTLNGQLTRADGTVLRSGRAAPMQVAAKGAYQPTMTMAYGNDPIDAGASNWEAWPVLLELPSGHRVALNRASTGTGGNASDGGPAYYTGSYEGVFMYRIVRNERVASLRLAQRERYTDGPRGIRIVEAGDYHNACLVTVEVTNTELALAGPREPAAGYYFVERSTGTRLRATRWRTTSGILGPLRVGLSPGRRIFTSAHVQWEVVNPRDVARAERGLSVLSPCRDMDLIFVRTIAAGSLTRSIKLPEFRVTPAQDTFFRR
jgi:hypothetical protein